jgi:hypothetical protein
VDLTIAEGIQLKWFLVVIGILLWHIAVTGVASRRTTPRTETFFKTLLVFADCALGVATLAGIAFVALAFIVRQGASGG